MEVQTKNYMFGFKSFVYAKLHKRSKREKQNSVKILLTVAFFCYSVRGLEQKSSH